MKLPFGLLHPERLILELSDDDSTRLQKILELTEEENKRKWTRHAVLILVIASLSMIGFAIALLLLWRR